MALPDNELKDLTVAELRGVAEMFAVDLDGLTKKADIIAEIEANGVTFNMYKSMLAPEEDEIVLEEDALEPVEVVEVVEIVEVEEEPVYSAEIVVKMIRKNHSYQIRGYKFTKEHPYAVVTESDADYLVEVDGGFRIATPRELREFYGQ